MKLFKSKEKYELYTYSSWGNYRDVDEVVLEGSKAEIKEYAKKAEFVWHEDASRPNGGYYSKSIDGYREKIYEIRNKQ